MLHSSAPPWRVVFMGSPDFAVPCLTSLLDCADFSVTSVYSMPDRPRGRGQQTVITPVKALAAARGIPVRTPSRIRGQDEEIAFLREQAPHFLVVVAYGHILPQSILDIPKIGPVNLHASLLPAYRGPSPMQTAILDGATVTGNSVMLMEAGLDTGPVLATEQIAITEFDTFATLHDQLSARGGPLLLDVLRAFARKEIFPVAQNHDQASWTSKITPATARIVWQQSADYLQRLVRAMNPHPGAWFNVGATRIKLFSATRGTDTDRPPGTVLHADPRAGWRVACGAGQSLCLEEIQRPGKARGSAQDILRGWGDPLPDSLADSDV